MSLGLWFAVPDLYDLVAAAEAESSGHELDGRGVHSLEIFGVWGFEQVLESFKK